MDNQISHSSMDYHALNAMLNLLDEEGNIQFDSDRQAARQFFLQHVNQNTVFFHNLKEKINYLVNEGYYEAEVIEQYDPIFLQEIWDQAYQVKFRFRTFLGAYKFFTAYALKTRDGKRYLERFEDRVVMTAITLARGDKQFAIQLMKEIIHQRFQPATPTFINAGKKSRGELISCFLLRIEDNMESIGVQSTLRFNYPEEAVVLHCY